MLMLLHAWRRQVCSCFAISRVRLPVVTAQLQRPPCLLSSAGLRSVCYVSVHCGLFTCCLCAPADVSMSAYLSLLEGGASGEFYQEMRDFFVYCQIRSQVRAVASD